MIIKTNKKDTYLITPEDTKKFLGIDTLKYTVIDKTSFSFYTKLMDDHIVNEKWTDEDIDGRKFRKLKKEIIMHFGDAKLEDYKTTNLVYETLSKKFINTSGVSEVIKNALANDMNLVLFGKGGFGKSEMCNELFGGAELKDRVFIKSLSEATTEEDLFGGINMKKMTDEGTIEYNCQNSFANSEIVIFEEIFDANPRVLAALKDTLTSKEIRNGNQRFPIKTKIIIGLTNKTYDEVIEDDSTEALTQRFPVSYKLQYEMTKLNTASLILNRYKDFEQNKLAAIVETIKDMSDLTPRKVLEMAKYIKSLDIKPSRTYSERITNNAMSPVINYLTNKSGIDFGKVLFGEIVNTKKDVREEKISDYDSMMDVHHSLHIIKNADLGGSIQIENVKKEIDEFIQMINKKVA
jgi:MoxR-like ATPase